jgi:prepilin peptidase CpaA
MLEIILLIFFPALLAYAAVSDLATMTISNRVSILLVAGFFVVAFASGMPWPALGMNLLAGLCVLALTFGMFAAGWMGGGDAKLAAATTLWFGFGGLAEYAVITALAGGILTFALIKLRDYPVPAFASEWGWFLRLHNPKSGIPYGVALAIGGLMTYPHTGLWRLAMVG